jgi:hypothetical protein
MARRGSNTIYILLAVILIAVVATYAIKMKEGFSGAKVCMTDKECSGPETGGCFCSNGQCGGGNDCGVKN